MMANSPAKTIQPAICRGNDSFLSIRLFYFMPDFFQGIFNTAAECPRGICAIFLFITFHSSLVGIKNSKCHLSVTMTRGRGAKEEILKVESRKQNGLNFAWIDAGLVAVIGRILHRHRNFPEVYIVNSFRTNISPIFAAKQGAERNGACHGSRHHVTTWSATRGQGHGQKM